MAKKSVRKKTPTRGPQAPFNPLAQPYNTNAQFDKAARSEAQLGYQPQLDEVSRQGKTEERRHTGRVGDINRDTSFYGKELSDAFDETRSALNDLIATHHASNEAGASTIAAALNRTRADEAARNQTITGGVSTGAPVSDVPDQNAILSAAVAGSGDAEITGQFGNLINRAGANRSLAGLTRIRAGETEAGRTAGVLNDLRDKKDSITANIPRLVSSARNTMLERARAAQNQGFTQQLSRDQLATQRQSNAAQQNIASGQLSLEERKLAETQRVNSANIRLNQDQLAQNGEKLKAAATAAKGTANEKHAALRAQRYDKGGSFLDSYLTPPKGFYIGARPTDKKGHQDKSLRPYHPDPAYAYNTLRTRFKLNAHDALELIHTSPIPSFHNYRPPSIRRAGQSVNDAVGGAVGAIIGTSAGPLVPNAPDLVPRRSLRRKK